jgi:hypothetical protein
MAIRRKWIYAGLGWAALVVASITAISLYDTPARTLRSVLQIEELPASVSNVKCVVPLVMTDDLASCSFQVEPYDMVSTLVGWRFSGENERGNSLDFAYDPADLTQFKVDYIYRADKDQFGPAGGHVIVVIDKDRRNALVDLYIE